MFDIIVPTRNRVNWLDRFINSVLETSQHPKDINFLIRYDDDDLATDAYIKNKDSRFIPFKKTRNLNKPSFYNELIPFTRENTIIGIYADDVIFRTNGWDVTVKNRFDTISPLALVWGRDGTHDEKLACHHFIKKQYYDVLGYVHIPIFKVVYSDNWITDVAKAANLAYFYDDLLFEHIHLVEMDNIYRESIARIPIDAETLKYSKPRMEEDINKLINANKKYEK